MDKIEITEVIKVLKLVQVIAEIIHEAGQVPSGHLYAAMMEKVDFDAYTKIIKILKDAGFVEEKNHLLIWVGPKIKN